jgi:hypothetical protein
MQNCPLLTLVIFLLGFAVGALLNSIYRSSTLSSIKEAFECEPKTLIGQDAQRYLENEAQDY